MISAHGSPVIVGPSGEQLLERVPLSGPESTELYSERWLQDLLYRHPAGLPIGELDASYADLRPACQEMSTPAGPIDVTYITRSGRPVIVEAKLWRNPEARRKVIGQILDYAKELARWDFGDLDRAVRRARTAQDGAAPRGLLDIVGIPPNSEESARFHDSVTRSLRRGELLLLIIGDGIREGVGEIADFLEAQASLHFTLGLVEMAIYRMPEGAGHLVQPRVLAQSAIVRRTVVELRDGALQVRDDAGASAADASQGEEDHPDLVGNRRRFEAFWSKFLKVLRLDDAAQVIAPLARAQNQYFMFPRETTAWISAYVAESKQRAGVYLTFARGPIGDRIYSALLEERPAIERELALPVEWRSDGRKHDVMIRRNFQGGFVDRQDDEVLRTLADWTNRYVNVFRARVEKLARQIA